MSGIMRLLRMGEGIPFLIDRVQIICIHFRGLDSPENRESIPEYLEITEGEWRWVTLMNRIEDKVCADDMERSTATLEIELEPNGPVFNMDDVAPLVPGRNLLKLYIVVAPATHTTPARQP